MYVEDKSICNIFSLQAAAAPKPTMNQLMTGNQVEKDKNVEICAILYFQASSGLGSAWPDGNQQQQQQQQQGNQEINPFFWRNCGWLG